jgi:hypothetical protein
MRRIKLVVAVLSMLVVMVGSAVPALAQGRGDDQGQGDGNRGDDHGQVDYNRGYDYGQGDYNRGYDYGQGDYDHYYPDYAYYANDYYGNGGLFGPCGLFATYDPYTGTCY